MLMKIKKLGVNLVEYRMYILLSLPSHKYVYFK